MTEGSTATRKKSKKLYSTGTLSSSARALPIERQEFQDLSSLVAELRNQSLRHLEIESNAQTEFDYMNAQMKSSRKTLSKFAEAFATEFDSFRTEVHLQLQEQQVNTSQRFQDLENQIDRLEFRFSHHVRDCQSVADQIDNHQQHIAALKNQISEAEIRSTREIDQQNGLSNTLKYNCLKMEEKLSQSTSLCETNLTMFEEKMKQYAKDLENQIAEFVENTQQKLIDFDECRKRQSLLLHKNVDDITEFRDKLAEVGTLRQALQRQQTRSIDILENRNNDFFMLENKLMTFEASLDAMKSGTMHKFKVVEMEFQNKTDTITKTMLGIVDILHDRKFDN